VEAASEDWLGKGSGRFGALALNFRRLPAGGYAWCFKDDLATLLILEKWLPEFYSRNTARAARDREIPVRDFGTWVYSDLLEVPVDSGEASEMTDALKEKVQGLFFHHERI